MHQRVVAEMGDLTTNPYYPFSTVADHSNCSYDWRGQFWWDNGEMCPIQKHEAHR